MSVATSVQKIKDKLGLFIRIRIFVSFLESTVSMLVVFRVLVYTDDMCNIPLFWHSLIKRCHKYKRLELG